MLSLPTALAGRGPRAPSRRRAGATLAACRSAACSLAAAARPSDRPPRRGSFGVRRSSLPDDSQRGPSREHCPPVRRPQRPAAQPDAVRALLPLHPGGPGRPHLAVAGHHEGAALVRGGSARRQPGADRPDDPGTQAADVPAAGRHGLQGDRGRVPLGQPDRLRLRPPADRERPDPGRRRHPGADPGPRAPDRADVRGHRRCRPGDRAPVQLHLHPAAAGRVRAGPRRHQGHRHPRRAAVPEVRREPQRYRGVLRVLPRVLHRHRAGVRGRGVRRGLRRVAADARTARRS